MLRKAYYVILAILFVVAMIYSYGTKENDKNIILNEFEIQEELIQDINTENVLNCIVENEILVDNTEGVKLKFIEINQDKNTMEKEKEQEDKIIGKIKIEKINFEGTIYEGTTGDILKKGVGHFKNSPYFNGNVCLAAHNTNEFWANLKTLDNGDLIVYESFLGTKDYEVYSKKQIDENDWFSLEDTNENLLTLITCVKGEREKRLCVQAREII